MADDSVIRMQDVWKRYGLPLAHVVHRARHGIRSLRKGRWPRRGELDSGLPWALREFNLEVRRGDTIGIIGRNGAGKSTMLKVLAGVTRATRGSIRTRGPIFPMIELNAGLHVDLTGRENVFLLGAIMGLSKKAVREKLPAIIQFSELEDAIDTPVRTYSTGMLARLGFSVAMNVDADILLIDEVLAVGDIGFQNRCLRRMKERREAGSTIVFVSHAMEMVQYLCPRVIHMADGRVVDDGDPERVITQYENSTYRDEARSVKALQNATMGFSSDDFKLCDVTVRNGKTKAADDYRPEDGFLVDFHCETSVALEGLIFSFALLNHRRECCVWEYFEGKHFRAGLSGGNVTLRIVIPPIPLSGGMYSVNFMARDAGSLEKVCHFKGISPFSIAPGRRERGVLTVPVRWECHSDPGSGNQPT